MARFYPIFYRNLHNLSAFQDNWLILSNWSGERGNYQAIIEAGSELAEKRQLAQFITGNVNDWILLGGQNNLTKGEKINISPLLAKFENNLREKIVSLCVNEQLKSKFQSETVIVRQGRKKVKKALIGAVEISMKGEAASINLYFGRKPYGQIECLKAVNLIYAKAVLDLLGQETFDAVGFNDVIPSNEANPLKNKAMADMLSGDRGWIRNFSDYLEKHPKGVWQAENVIKINKDLYWGFGDSPPKSEQGWKNRLREIYNSVIKAQEQRTDEVPGFDGDIVFIDVAYVAQTVFGYHITK